MTQPVTTTAVATTEQPEVNTICDLLVLEVACLQHARTGTYNLQEAKGAVAGYKWDTKPMGKLEMVAEINKMAQRSIAIESSPNPFEAYIQAIKGFAYRIDLFDQNDTNDWP